MSAEEWLAERARIEQAATDGPWIAATGAYGWDHDDEATHVWHREPIGGGTYKALIKIVDNELNQTAPEDAEFIADARTTMPKMRAALEAVLALHWGEPYAQGPGYCAECEHRWPCGTYGAITEALT